MMAMELDMKRIIKTGYGYDFMIHDVLEIGFSFLEAKAAAERDLQLWPARKIRFRKA